METLTLRDVRPEDEAGFFELFAAVRTGELGMQEWEPGLRDQILRLQFEAQRRSYRAEYPAADDCLIELDGAPVGWVVVDRSGPELHGIDIALLAEKRGQGLGTRVIRALQEEAAAGDRPMVTTVNRTNVQALAFYVRLGFRGIKETDAHIVMEWRR